MIGAYRARVAPFNVNYRYVEEELVYLLTDSKAKAIVYHAEFAPRVAAIRDRLPELRVLIQVADESGNDAAARRGRLRDRRRARPAPAQGMPAPDRRRPLHPLHRRHHRHAQGRAVAPGRHLRRRRWVARRSAATRPFDRRTTRSPSRAQGAAGAMSMLMIPPFMHGAAQWAAFNIDHHGRHASCIPDDVERLRPRRRAAARRARDGC